MTGCEISDGSRRAFYKEFMKVVEASDVVIQVLDARDPLGSRCVDVERMVHKAGPTKRIVLLVNKIGMVFLQHRQSSPLV
jgi:nuclear GTP-binding protein